MRSSNSLYTQLEQIMRTHDLEGFSPVPEKFINMYKNLQEDIDDFDLADEITSDQAKAISLEFISRLYKGCGHDPASM